MESRWARAVGMAAASITTGMALVVVAAVAEPAGADPAPADVAVTASAPVQARVGVPYSHTFTVTNAGASAATDVDLEIDVNGRGVGPGGTTLLSPPPLGCKVVTSDAFGSTSLDCHLGTIAPGHSASRSIIVSVSSPGLYRHGGYASTSSPESNLENNSAATSANVVAGPTDSLLGVVTELLEQLLFALKL